MAALLIYALLIYSAAHDTLPVVQNAMFHGVAAISTTSQPRALKEPPAGLYQQTYPDSRALDETRFSIRITISPLIIRTRLITELKLQLISGVVAAVG